MKRFITIAALFLAATTINTSNALTIINETSQSFIIDYYNHWQHYSCALDPAIEADPERNFDFEQNHYFPIQHVSTNAHLLTITLRNPESPDGQFPQSQLDRYVQTVIDIRGIDTIKIKALNYTEFSQAIRHFEITGYVSVDEGHSAGDRNDKPVSPDSAYGSESPQETSRFVLPAKQIPQAKSLGIVTLMDYSFSSIREDRHSHPSASAWSHENSDSAFFE